MKLILATLALCAAVAVTASSVISDVNPPFRYLTAVDGVAFFAGDDELRTWSGAKEYCATQGMRLASIQTQAQFDGLRAVHDESTFTGDFWTAGRDSQKRSQFTWDTNQTEVSVEVDGFFVINGALPFQTCLAFHHQANVSYVTADVCTAEKLTFCEVSTN